MRALINFEAILSKLSPQLLLAETTIVIFDNLLVGIMNGACVRYPDICIGLSLDPGQRKFQLFDKCQRETGLARQYFLIAVEVCCP